MAIEKYVPILRPKQGEVWAIRDLSELARNRITPFFDVHPVQIKNGKKEKSLDDHLDSILKRICKKSFFGTYFPSIFLKGCRMENIQFFGLERVFAKIT